jgi:hypothetical protein
MVYPLLISKPNDFSGFEFRMAVHETPQNSMHPVMIRMPFGYENAFRKQQYMASCHSTSIVQTFSAISMKVHTRCVLAILI